MRGVLSVLGMDHASQALLRMRDEVDGLASTEVDPARVVQAGVFDRLAGNLSALGFLIDMLSVQPQMAKSLFAYDAEAGTLSPVMGRAVSTEHMTIGLPAPAPVEPRLIEQAQMLAFSSVREDVPLVEVTRDLERLSHEAQAADQPALAATVLKAQEAIERAEDAAEPGDRARRAVRSAGRFRRDRVRAGGDRARARGGAAPDADRPVDDQRLPGRRRDARGLPRGSPRGDRRRPGGLPGPGARAGRPRLLTTLRRAFHTLKGSSRMVGLKEFGDAAWICEQLYNTHLAEQRGGARARSSSPSGASATSAPGATTSPRNRRRRTTRRP